MVFRGDPDRWTGRPTKNLRPHDPPPGYRPPRMPSSDWRWQAKARQSPLFVRVVTVILILLAIATAALIVLMIATHH